MKALWERVRSRRLARGHRALGRWEDLVSPRRCGPGPARGLGCGSHDSGLESRAGSGTGSAADLAGDAEAVADLLSGVEELARSGEVGRVVSAVTRWRHRQADAVLVVDQFEELFTLHAAETQGRFAALVAALRRTPTSTSCCRCVTTS